MTTQLFNYLLEADKVFSKFKDMTSVSSYQLRSHTVEDTETVTDLSGKVTQKKILREIETDGTPRQLVSTSKTVDTIVTVQVMSKEPWYDKDCFSLRNWESIHGVLNLVDDDFSMSVDFKNNLYPSILNFKSPKVKFKYFLKNFDFIKRYDAELNDFRSKRLSFEFGKDNLFKNFDSSLLSTINKICSLTSTNSFSFLIENKCVYFVTGDENASIDSGRILIQDNVDITPELQNMQNILIDCSYFSLAYSASNKDNVRFRVAKETLILESEYDNILTKISIRGKRK